MPEFETQRQPVPRVDSGEVDTALAFLGFAREAVLKKTEGLDDEQLRRQLVPSGTSLLWLVTHLTGVEYFWLDHHLRGTADVEAPSDLEDHDPAAAIEAYRAAIRRSDENVRAVGDPTTPLALLVDGESLSLRWALTHMLSETTRHAGHADILREQLDGVTGR